MTTNQPSNFFDGISRGTNINTDTSHFLYDDVGTSLASNSPQIQEGSLDMSFCCCIQNANGYVMASDSRSVIRDKNGALIKFTDNFPKIIYLKEAKIGVICAGQNSFNGKSISSFIKSLEKVLVGLTAFEATTYIAVQLQPLVYSIVNLCVAKADDNDISVTYIDIYRDKELTTPYRGDIWRNTGSSFDALRALYSITDANNNEVLAVNVSSMDLPELIAFAEHLVQTHIAVARFRAGEAQTIGGPIQTLAVDCMGEVIKNSRG